ncbi:MAG: AAA family ATPase [Erysipelotrichaceae bacterium]|nr:AAA family ATPase [Erysipelotrichaceae bacterium]
MPRIIFVSGACGSGKTVFTDACARSLVNQYGKTVYVIHGDDFHQGFVEPEDKSDFFTDGQASDPLLWENIIRFNWDCILSTADRALEQGLDVLIDYVIEDELPRVRELAKKHDAQFFYIVLTADENELTERILKRGDTDMIERSLFLKNKLDNMPENKGHLYDTTGKNIKEMIQDIDLKKYLINE